MSSQYTDTLNQGKNGGTVIADTTATTGDFGGLLIVEDAVIDTWNCSNLEELGDLEDTKTLPAGLYIPARFTSITLTSGIIIAFSLRAVNVVAPTFSYDAAAQTYFTAAEAADASAFDLTATNATYTATYTKAGHDALFRALKGESSIFDSGYGTKPTSSNVYAKITEMYFLQGVSSLSALVVKPKGAGTLTNNNFVGGDLTPVGSGAGLKGDGSTKYLESGLTFAAVDNDDWSLGSYYDITDAGSNFGKLISVSSNTHEIFDGANSNPVGNAQVRPSYSAFNVSTEGGFLIGSRTSSTAAAAYLDGSSEGTTTDVSLTAPSDSAEFYFYRRNDISAAYSASVQKMIYVGTGLTDAEAAYLSWCVNAWATYFGSNTYTNP